MSGLSRTSALRRTTRLARKTAMARTSWIARGRKEIPKVNPARQAKKAKRYSAGLAKSRRGEGYKLAMQRANGECEVRAPGLCGSLDGPLQAHHRTYLRFPGKGLASDFVICCPACHRWAEHAGFPHRRNGRRKAS